MELIIGQIPEAIYFSLFMIYAKNIKTKRLLLTILLTLEYILLTRFLVLNIWFQIIYTFLLYIILKLLYKEKTQIIDIFIFMESLILLLICTVPFLFLNIFINNIYLMCLFSKIVLFLIFFIIKNKLFKINRKFYKLWNRNDFAKRKIKSLTLRNISIVVFNILFYITNVLILYVGKGGVIMNTWFGLGSIDGE